MCFHHQPHRRTRYEPCGNDRVEVKDLDALADACQRLGCVLNRNQATYRWWGSSVGDYPLPAGFTAADWASASTASACPACTAKSASRWASSAVVTASRGSRCCGTSSAIAGQ